MNHLDHGVIRAGVERRLAVVETLVPPRPAWRTASDGDIRPALVRVGTGPAFRNNPAGDRRLALPLGVGALVLMLAYGLAGGGEQPGTLPTPPVTSPTAAPTSAPPSVAPSPSALGLLRPLIDPRLIIPIRPETDWTLVEDQADGLSLVYLLDDVGTLGYNVGLLVVEPHAVYDPVVETERLPLPSDLIGWIQDHPDLEAGESRRLTVAGQPATEIDAVVTYLSSEARGATAQFIDTGSGSLNLEPGTKRRIVLVELPDRVLLMIFESRSEFFDAGIEYFEDELALIQFEDGGPSP